MRSVESMYFDAPPGTGQRVLTCVTMYPSESVAPQRRARRRGQAIGTDNVYSGVKGPIYKSVRAFHESNNSPIKNEVKIHSGFSRPYFEIAPNPFMPRTTINFYNPQEQIVSLTLYTPKGEQVAALLNSPMGKGFHSLGWEPKGSISGMVVAALRLGKRRLTKKLFVFK